MPNPVLTDGYFRPHDGKFIEGETPVGVRSVTKLRFNFPEYESRFQVEAEIAKRQEVGERFFDLGRNTFEVRGSDGSLYAAFEAYRLN